MLNVDVVCYCTGHYTEKPDDFKCEIQNYIHIPKFSVHSLFFLFVNSMFVSSLFFKTPVESKNTSVKTQLNI